jgi:hypothetical protein
MHTTEPLGLQSGPILIFGAPRSGTTYLRQILDAHPDVFVTNEFRVFSWLCAAVDALPRDDARLFEQRSEFVAQLQLELPGLVRRYYAQLAGSARWWGDKNPHYAQDPAILQNVAALFPDARFVHIHRDPRAVIASLLRKRHADGSPWIGLEDAHAMVVGHVRNALDFAQQVGPERCFRVRYERLVADDEAMARSLFAWLGLPIAEPVLELCRQQQQRRTAFSGPTSDLRAAGSKEQAIEAWRAVVPAARQRESLQFLAPLLLELRYENEAGLEQLRACLPS